MGKDEEECESKAAVQRCCEMALEGWEGVELRRLPGIVIRILDLVLELIGRHQQMLSREIT